MRYALLNENGIVIQVQPSFEDGFVEVDDSVFCGMKKEGGVFVTPPLSEADKVITKKFEQIEILGKLTVEISSGKIFDANNEARSNMSTAVLVARRNGQTETPWKLANDITVIVTLDELEEAVEAGLTKFAQVKDIL